MKEMLLRILDKIKLQLGYKTRYLKMLDKRVIMLEIRENGKVPECRKTDSIIALHECKKLIEREYAIGYTAEIGGITVIPIKAVDHDDCVDLLHRYKLGY